MPNIISILRILIVIGAGLYVYRNSKSAKSTIIAILVAFVIVWGLSFLVDLVME